MVLVCRRLIARILRRPRLVRAFCAYAVACVVVQSLLVLTGRDDETVLQALQQPEQQPQPQQQQPDIGVNITETSLVIAMATTTATAAKPTTSAVAMTSADGTTLNWKWNRTEFKAVNTHPFKYVINKPDVCTGFDVYIIAYVHTAPSHYAQRSVIRQTWANASTYGRVGFLRVVFAVGLPNGTDVQTALELEASTYGDILQEDFVDSYHNLTYKAIAALKWISERCAHARYVLKVDDDIFVNPFGLIQLIQRFERTNAETDKSTAGTIMCAVWLRMPVLRKGQWKVEKEVWPDDYYPQYCSGSAFVMTIDVARTLYLTSFDVPFFWIDDVYVTGLLTRKANESGNVVRFVNLDKEEYAMFDDKLEARFTGPRWKECVFGFVFARRNEATKLFPSLFKKVQQLYRDELLLLASPTNANQSHASTKLSIIKEVGRLSEN